MSRINTKYPIVFRFNYTQRYIFSLFAISFGFYIFFYDKIWGSIFISFFTLLFIYFILQKSQVKIYKNKFIILHRFYKKQILYRKIGIISFDQLGLKISEYFFGNNIKKYYLADFKKYKDWQAMIRMIVKKTKRKSGFPLIDPNIHNLVLMHKVKGFGAVVSRLKDIENEGVKIRGGSIKILPIISPMVFYISVFVLFIKNINFFQDRILKTIFEYFFHLTFIFILNIPQKLKRYEIILLRGKLFLVESLLNSNKKIKYEIDFNECKSITTANEKSRLILCFSDFRDFFEIAFKKEITPFVEYYTKKHIQINLNDFENPKESRKIILETAQKINPRIYFYTHDF